MMRLDISGGYEYQRKLIRRCVDYFVLTHMGYPVKFDLTIKLRSLKECYGYTEEVAVDSYKIAIDKSLCIRDLVSTMMHELVHVKQYNTRTWLGDGEQEACDLQFILADKMWKDNWI